MERARPVRDYQRKKIYATQFNVDNRRLDTVTEIQHWIDRVIQSSWWRERYPAIRKIHVHDGRRHRRATAYMTYQSYGPTISMPRVHRDLYTVTHEIAHIATRAAAIQSQAQVAPHGRDYARVWLDLVHRFVSDAAARELRDSFKKNRVRYRGTDAQHFARVEKRRTAQATRPRPPRLLMADLAKMVQERGHEIIPWGRRYLLKVHDGWMQCDRARLEAILDSKGESDA